MALVGIEWVRPWGLAALVLPLFVLYVTRRPGRPQMVPVGSFEIWRSLGEQKRAQGARRQRSIPLDRWLLVLGLTLGALALAGPERVLERRSEEMHIVIDRSPSMYLPHAAGGTRLDRALERARELADGEVRWIAAGALGRESPEQELPGAWLTPPTIPREEVDWSRFDLPGYLWVTDAALDPEPRLAGFAASGGDAVHGPVASSGTTRFDWDGAAVRPVASGVPTPHVAMTGVWPALLAEFVADVWAVERGVSVHSNPREGCVLELRGPAAVTDGVAVDVARDAWTARVRAAREGVALLTDGRELAEWLGAGTEAGRLTLLAAGPGLISSALLEVAEPSGDPAAFAVSWSRLLDEHLLPMPGVVRITERVAVGLAGFSAPSEALPSGGEAPEGFSAWLAGAAALFAAMALGVKLA